MDSVDPSPTPDDQIDLKQTGDGSEGRIFPSDDVSVNIIGKIGTGAEIGATEPRQILNGQIGDIVVNSGQEDAVEDDDCIDLSEDNENWILSSANILKKFQKIASEADLQELRQVDENFYQMLNPTYFDIANLVIDISIVRNPNESGKAPTATIAVQDELKKLKKERTAKEIKEMELNSKMLLKLTSSKLAKITNENTEKRNYIELTLQQFSSLKHIFRAVLLPSFNLLHLKIIDICTQLQPYVTNVITEPVAFTGLRNWTFTKLLNKFTNLRNLHFMEVSHNGFHGIKNLMHWDELEVVLKNLKSKPKILMQMSAEHDEILSKFGTLPNVSFKMSFCIQKPGVPMLQEFQDVTTKFGNLKNISFICLKMFDENRLLNLAQLKTFTVLCLRHAKLHTELCLHISLELNSIDFPNENAVKQCLILLSPFTTALVLNSSNSQMDVVTVNCEWPRMTYLEIIGCQHSLEIIKKCPILKTLKITFQDQESCIFTNKEKSREQNLHEYFGNLPEMEFFSITTVYHNNPYESLMKNIIKINGLNRYLKGLFPKLLRYENNTTVYQD